MVDIEHCLVLDSATETELADATRIVHEAIDAGITFMDNAWEYHEGESEVRMGRALAPRVAVIPKGTTHVFWKAVEAGARKGAAASGLELVWKGPLQENDRAQLTNPIVERVVEDHGPTAAYDRLEGREPPSLRRA